MQIRMKDQLSADEALMLLEVANAEVASLHQQLTEQEKTIEQLRGENAALLAKVRRSPAGAGNHANMF